MYVNGEASREASPPMLRGDAERLRLPHRLHSPGRNEHLAAVRRPSPFRAPRYDGTVPTSTRRW